MHIVKIVFFILFHTTLCNKVELHKCDYSISKFGWFLYDLDKNIMWIINTNYLILAVDLLMKLVIKHKFVLILIHWIGKPNYFLYINEWLLIKRTIHSRHCICLYLPVLYIHFEVKLFALLFLCVFQNKANVGEMPVCVD